MDMVNRGKVRSIAATIVKKERQSGKPMPVEDYVNVVNSQYGLVKEEDLPAFREQVLLDVAAERHAAQYNFGVDTPGYLKLKFDEAVGSAFPDPNGLNPA